MKYTGSKRTIGLVLVLSIFLMTALTSTAFAAFYYNWGGSVAYQYMPVSKKLYKETDSQTGIRWQAQDSDSGTYRLYFGVWNHNADMWGRKTIIFEPHEKNRDFDIERTGTRRGGYYTLYAGRENWIDPYTYVGGNWRP
ncbi:hypothetical protein [Erysipelothrix aquatica]|uniref:hypothetical protein n=1 Tax=Erysipelothrix aquatica TaxID=2683714 RepID=UPI00135A1ED3|nr:hypothetical protein [Erysipelothrix aquatica]